jgi:ABC-type Fe3+-hydroxamate transport system substrate-binding protein
MVILAAALVVSVGVGAYLLLDNNDNRPGDVGDIIVTDNRGVEVTFTESPKRVMSLGSSFTDTLVTLGCIDQVFAVDQSSVTRLTGTEYAGLSDKQRLTSGAPSTSTAEYALLYGIDCVIVWNFPSYSDGIKALEDAGVKVLALYPTDVGSVKEVIRVIGTVMGKSDVASALIEDIDRTIDDITELAKAKAGGAYGDYKRVYVELDTATRTSPGSGTITGSMLDLLGVNYIRKGTTGSANYGSEAINVFNPDIIVFMGPIASGYDVLRSGTINTSGVVVDIYDNTTGEGFNGNWASATPSFIKGLVYLYELIYGEPYEP